MGNTENFLRGGMQMIVYSQNCMCLMECDVIWRNLENHLGHGFKMAAIEHGTFGYGSSSQWMVCEWDTYGSELLLT